MLSTVGSSTGGGPQARSSTGESRLRVMMIFAHPDEGEIYTGGTAALYAQLGHEVKFVSLTNGDAGHYSMAPKALAERRFREAMEAKSTLGLAEYEVLDCHDKALRNTEGTRRVVAGIIDDWGADVVFTYYAIEGGHNDNMCAGRIVRDAAAGLSCGSQTPLFLYVRDYYTCRFSYIPDVAMAIDDVWPVKLAACGAHESQVFESVPHGLGILAEVQASEEKRQEALYNNTYPFSCVTQDNLRALEKWYGKDRASEVTYVEAFEVAEFGRQVTNEEMLQLLPMLPAM